jgi:hypothetical protein
VFVYAPDTVPYEMRYPAISGSGFRRSLHTASAYSDRLDSLVVTHPYHPLAGQRISILFERTYRDPTRGRVYVCEAGPLRTVALPEHFTDRGAAPAARPLTVDVLIDLAVVVAALRPRLTGREEGTSLVSE